LTKSFIFTIIKLMELTKQQWKRVADIFADIGKLVILVLVLGQIVAPEGFDLKKFIGGVIFSVILFSFSVIIDKGE